MSEEVTSEYYTPEQLAIKCQILTVDGLPDVGRIKRKAYRWKIPGMKKICGELRFRRIDIDKALLSGGF